MNMQTEGAGAAGKARLSAGRFAGCVGIAANLVLFAAKAAIGILSGSVSILADAVNNLTDVGSSVLTLIGYVISGRPADKEHPYGHARMEYLCGLFVSVIVAVIGIEFFRSSVEKLVSGSGTESFSLWAIVVMGLAIVVKGGLAFYYTRVGRRIGSATLRAAAADSRGDMIATGAVLLGMILTPYTGPLTDGVIGAAIAVYITVSGIRLIVETSSPLLGAAPDPDLLRQISVEILKHDGVLGMHDLVIHSYGELHRFATVHVEVDGEENTMVTHDMIDNIEWEIARDLGVQLVIHMDPIHRSDARINALRELVERIVREIADETGHPISMHDFRVVFGVTHQNLVFDVAVASDFPLKDEDLCAKITEKVRAEDATYNAVITTDRDYFSRRYGQAED